MKDTKRPSDETATPHAFPGNGPVTGFPPLSPLASAPPPPTLTRSIVPFCRSARNTSAFPLVSPATIFEAVEKNTTYRPSGVKTGAQESPFAAAPPIAFVSKVVVSAARSCTKMSRMAFVSAATRLEAALTKATRSPSPDIVGIVDAPLAWALESPAEISSVVPAALSRKKMSASPFASLDTRLVASLTKATSDPS